MRLRPLSAVLVAATFTGSLLGISGVANAAVVPNPNCQLTVPANPLSAAGLSTPYQLAAQDPKAGPCDEANTDQSAFVEAAVLDPASGKLSVYHPLVVTAGDKPAVAPVVPVLPANAVVAVWFGSNGDTLKLVGPGAHRAVNGLHGDLFGQFAYINAPALFKAANAAVTAGTLVVPPLGVGADKLPCPTTRDFAVVDQDQSDNLSTAYAEIGGKLAQWTAAVNSPVVHTKMTNGSDEGLLANRIDPALGCAPFKLPSLDDPGVQVTSLVGNELSAAANQKPPVALVPLNDPMVLLNNGMASVAKTDLYRAGVDQAPVNPVVETPKAYCGNLAAVALARQATDKTLFAAADSPTPGVKLDAFLATRYATTLTLLGCPNPQVTMSHGHHSDQHRERHQFGQ